MTRDPAPTTSSPTSPGARTRHVVVMGVSGTGKTTVAVRLAERLGWEFVEGDDLHPRTNIEKMSAGIPLDDEDRRPWLEELSRVIGRHHDDEMSSVLTCSALKRRYRDVLRADVPDDGVVFFVHLAAPFEVLSERVGSREHFMPPSLLQSQLDTLEPLGADESGVVLDVSRPVADVVAGAIDAVEALASR